VGLRLRRSLKLMPGLRLNLGLGGLSLTAGPRGASVNLGSRGLFGNLGLPGTGISYRRRLDRASSDTEADSSIQVRLELDVNGRLELRGTDGLPLEPRVERQVRRDGEARLRNWLEERCREIDDGIEAIASVHLNTPAPDLHARLDPRPFTVFPPTEPEEPHFGIWDRLLPWVKRRKLSDHQEAQQSFDHDRDEWNRQRERHELEQAAAQVRHLELLRSHPPAVELALSEALQRTKWPRETNVDFALDESGARLVLEVDLPEIEDMPTRDAEVAARGLKLNIKTRSDTAIRRVYSAHVHGVVFCAIGIAFSALPSLAEVVCSAYSQRPNPETAVIRDDYLLSVLVRRVEWCQIDFSRLEDIDVVSCLERFQFVRALSAGGRFSPIEPIERLTTVDTAPKTRSEEQT
jgi:hypothetical protein